MEEELTEWKIYDMILKYLSENQQHTFSCEEIQKAIFPELTASFVQAFVIKLPTIPSNFPLVEFRQYGGGALRATDFTSIFLRDGGFVGEHEKFLKKKEEEAKEKKEEKDFKGMVRQEMSLSIEKLINENIDYRQTKSRANTGYHMSIILALVSIVSLIVSIKSCQVSTSSPKPGVSVVQNHSLHLQ
jgi:hypothetical protein